MAGTPAEESTKKLATTVKAVGSFKKAGGIYGTPPPRRNQGKVAPAKPSAKPPAPTKDAFPEHTTTTTTPTTGAVARDDPTPTVSDAAADDAPTRVRALSRNSSFERPGSTSRGSTPSGDLERQRSSSSVVDSIWDEHGNVKIGVALSGAAELLAAHSGDSNVLLAAKKPLDITQDQYRLMYLISRLQNVKFEPKTTKPVETGGGPDDATKATTAAAAAPSVSFDTEPAVVPSSVPNGVKVSPAPAPAEPARAPAPPSRPDEDLDVADGNSLAGRRAAETISTAPRFRRSGSGKALFRKAVHLVIKQLRVAFALHRHYQFAETHEDLKFSTRWVHRTPLLVYMYEGILLQLFDYDFSPSSELAGRGEVNMNVSSEGVDDLSDLQEMGLILRLKLATKEHYTTTSYQVLPAGVAALKSMKQADKDLVDAFLADGVTIESAHELHVAASRRAARRDFPTSEKPPPPENVAPFEVRFDQESAEFVLSNDKEEERVSTVTEFEDVSYVCSPYLPECVRPPEGPHRKRRAFSDFSPLAHLSRQGTDTLREEQTHTVTLSNIRILATQYLVNGPNEVNALNEKLSLHASREELRDGQAGLVSAHVDNSPTATTFEVAMSGMCAIFPMDYVRSKMANFEGKVYLPEDPGVVQLENFGIHVHSNGEVIFGVQVESVMDKMRDDIPVDIIARLVFDLHEDSASTLESISSTHQRLLMASLRGKDFVRLRQQQNLVNHRRGAKIDLGMNRARLNDQFKRGGNAALNLLGSVPDLIRSGTKRIGLSVGNSARDAAALAESANFLKSPSKGRQNAVVKKSAVHEPSRVSRVNSLFLSEKQDPVPTPKKAASFDRAAKDSSGLSRRSSYRDDSEVADLAVEEEPLHATDAVESSMTEAVTSNYSFNMFTAYLCDSVSPTSDVSVLLDGEDAENDITQIVGRINDAANLPCGGCVISGEKGMIVSGRSAKAFEQLIVVHCSVMARRIFVSSFFHRLFEMESEIDAIQYSIQNHIGKPSGLAEIRRRVMEACKQASLLDSLLTQAKATSHDLPDIDASMEEAAEGKPSYEVMLETLQTRGYREELILRLKDLESLLKCARLGLDSLRENTDVISEMQMFKLQESLQSNTRNLESLFRSNESASSSLQIMQLVIGGSLAFSMMDRVTGEWTVMDTPWGNAFYETYIEPPGVWFCLSLLAFTIIVTGLHFTMKLMLRQASADMNVRYSLHVRVNIAKMRVLLNERRLYSEEADTDVEGNNMYKVAWEEPGDVYGGTPLRVEISVDQGHARLCTLNLKYNRREGKMSLPEVQDRFLRMLVDDGVIVDRDELGELIRPDRAATRAERRRAEQLARSRERAAVKMRQHSSRQNTSITSV